MFDMKYKTTDNNNKKVDINPKEIQTFGIIKHGL